MVFFELDAEKLLCVIGLHFGNIIFSLQVFLASLKTPRVLSFFALLCVEIIRREGTMDWLKKFILIKKHPFRVLLLALQYQNS